jgi:hypothetical protein
MQLQIQRNKSEQLLLNGYAIKFRDEENCVLLLSPSKQGVTIDAMTNMFDEGENQINLAGSSVLREMAAYLLAAADRIDREPK